MIVVYLKKFKVYLQQAKYKANRFKNYNLNYKMLIFKNNKNSKTKVYIISKII